MLTHWPLCWLPKIISSTMKGQTGCMSYSINQLRYFPSTSLIQIPASFLLCIQQPFMWSITETSLYREQIIVHVKNLSYLMVTDESSTIAKCCLEEERPMLFTSWHFSLFQCPQAALPVLSCYRGICYLSLQKFFTC